MVTADNFDREGILQIISDLHKDAYGFRNRSICWELCSDEELIEYCNTFSQVSEQNRIDEIESQKQCLIEFNKTVDKTIAAGAHDRATALRWLFDAEDLDQSNMQDIEQFVWWQGILFTDEGRALVEELTGILTAEIV